MDKNTCETRRLDGYGFNQSKYYYEIFLDNGVNPTNTVLQDDVDYYKDKPKIQKMFS